MSTKRKATDCESVATKHPSKSAIVIIAIRAVFARARALFNALFTTVNRHALEGLVFIYGLQFGMLLALALTALGGSL
ncbi:hypothetical protein [Rhodoferax antarcticus]|uniref:Uncharacterized protein n=1 Tax=Rhodoferax antarcticus ANT.BR TaxID=1111071 RepID=A0A1Q8YA77_9BURK|nr:hypothetical protein [Rhodoferax antarcticus]APW47068.1 hypothetical protein RA876_12665 [Rhodoferax antarcticus]OLP04945.1 hypothetical protein BLL52_3765 [Rhodoferax antarcticus ANT.BR]